MDSDLTVTELLIKRMSGYPRIMQIGRKRNERLAGQIDEMLDKDEKPLDITFGQVKKKRGLHSVTTGIAVVTNKRLFYAGSLVGETAMEQFRLEKIDSVKQDVLFGASSSLTVTSAGSTLTLIRSVENTRFVKNLREAIDNHQNDNQSSESTPTASKKFCSQCGEKLTEGAKFCTGCGAAV